jgi:D-alanine-D-alanine ligase
MMCSLARITLIEADASRRAERVVAERSRWPLRSDGATPSTLGRVTGRTRVAVVFGGRSSEHAISCVSAGSVLRHLDRERFDVIPVGIARSGAWVLGTDDPAQLAIQNRQLPAVDPTATALALPGDPTRGGLVVLEPGRAGEVLAGVDVVFPVLHGPFGEDGTIQGLLEMAGLPYVGPGVFASAAGMDKEFAKKLLASAGLPVGDLVVLRPGTATLTSQERKRLGLPVFVKPARAGSSVGITRVTDWTELDGAIAAGRAHDPKVLVEAAVAGREVECGVLEFPDGSVRASLPAEIRIVGAGADYYDFDAKYLDDVCEFDIPAKLDDDVTDRVRESAIAAFRALDCQGLARVDFFVGTDGVPVVNEVNTLPGFTPISMYPRMWAVTGIDYPTLLTTLVDTALARGTGLR